MRNFSISFAGPSWRQSIPAGLVVLALLLGTAPNLAAKGKKNRDLEADLLIQPFVGPKYAQWLVGPIARMATKGEIDEYLLLESDDQAVAFIENFWQRRNPRPGEPSHRLRETFDERAGFVDSLYGESLYRGRHTDRGLVHILYGAPEETDHEVAPWYGGPPLVVWRYSKKAEPGLDGEKPKKEYRFIRQGDRTVFYYDSMRQRQLRKQRPNPNPPRNSRPRPF